MLTKSPKSSFWVNLGLLMFGLVMVFSGILLQFGYHHGHHGEIDSSRQILGLNYFNWSDIHLISIILVSIGMVFHLLWHWKWYKSVLQKRKLILKNQQLILLTVIFLSVAVTGYISWIIKLSGGSEINRKNFMEVHDKITWILLGYLIFHVAERFKWFITTFKKTRKSKKKPIEIERPVQMLETKRRYNNGA